jgi:hypothetical protein
MTNRESGVINDLVVNSQFPNSTPVLFKENMNDGSIEYTLIIRTKGTNMTTHRSDVRLDPKDFGTLTVEKIRQALLDNMRTL